MMLKQHSSSQLLPSRSRRLWRKLCLWSHRNLQNSWSMKVVLRCVNNNSNKKGGYSNNIQEPKWGAELEKVGFPRSFAGEFRNKSNSNHRNNDNHHHKSNVRYGGVSGLVPQSQSVARNISKVLDTNSVTQYPNSSSKLAHITRMDIRIIPNFSQFSNLRTLNLSGNSIAHITPGMLPKGLQYLDLSRNNIAAIAGLRELTRLRVLSLGYNRIFRIGKGLSKCTLIKELNLAGNKISELEGLHRLSKLTVLDLSFNKITTDKPLGQLVANYNSLRALNLLGNPIESNIRGEKLQKVVSGLLLHLVYFNKQPIKPQRAQEVVTSSFTKSPVLNNKLYHRRRVLKMAVDQGESSSSGHRSSRAVGGPKSGKRSKGRSHQSNIKEWRSSSHAAAFH
ncbi:leucine-rich repeat protein soc-2-like [Macadamia integrifolia]|uniref:leucine-rich repeat protein soc-2-like n=1 Tax=Macadamia integrifolia TaxID=60698 RepID=UPI001C4E5E9C|nr:leucine-rich repeat protein soc-2-like [Macadamia integrifolia]